MKLIFATNNSHKISEIRAALPSWFSIVTLEEAGIFTDIPEPHDTLEENAAEKARTIFALTGTDCFSEDTGLEVPALNNEPGVHSARYAGEERSFQKNIEKLLAKLDGVEDRQARFRTVICLLLGNKEYFFEGICQGHIISGQKGQEGFGYDPVFVPEGSDRTFAEMDMKEKNRFSHRKKALDNLVVFLNNMDINQ
ncbi:MAG TPA: RdgB/HAM1 family non-canonical purine NTP pyrophosphatase [Flavisolibacter sp.]|jgi:XTP/dITP diphosphohydrolase